MRGRSCGPAQGMHDTGGTQLEEAEALLMRYPRLGAGLVLLLTACGNSTAPTTAQKQPDQLQLSLTAANDTVPPGDTVQVTATLVAVAPAVQPSGLQRSPPAGVAVNFVVLQGGGTVFAPVVLTNSAGEAAQQWTVGAVDGWNILEARVIDSTGTPLVVSRDSVLVMTPVAAQPNHLEFTFSIPDTVAANTAVPITAQVWEADSAGGFVRALTPSLSVGWAGTLQPGTPEPTCSFDSVATTMTCQPSSFGDPQTTGWDGNFGAELQARDPNTGQLVPDPNWAGHAWTAPTSFTFKAE